MKKIRLLLVLLCTFSFIIVNASELSGPTPTTGWMNQLKLSEFVRLTPKEISTLMGKKMDVFQKLFFKLARGKMKRYLRSHDDLLVADYLKTEEKDEKKLNFLWLAIGALAPILGKLIIYLITDATSAFIWIPLILAPVAIAFLTKQSKIKKKSVLIGAGVLVVVGLIAALINSNAY